jgi:hypothetical protein
LSVAGGLLMISNYRLSVIADPRSAAKIVREIAAKLESRFDHAICPYAFDTPSGRQWHMHNERRGQEWEAKQKAPL